MKFFHKIYRLRRRYWERSAREHTARTIVSLMAPDLKRTRI